MTTKRLFFALWPNATAVAQLADLQKSLPIVGRLVAPSHLHITLAFIGDADPPYADCLRRAAESVTFEPFTLVFDRLGYFHKPQILWLGPSEIPAALNKLYERLTRELAGCGFESDSRGFKPHISLARKSRGLSDQKFVPLQCTINSFTLVQSRPTNTGADYCIIQRFGADG